MDTNADYIPDNDPAQVSRPKVPPATIVRESGDITQLCAALVTFHGAMVNPERDREVEVKPKEGGRSYKFKYATMGSVMNAIRKPMLDSGLAIIQVITYEPRPWLTTKLLHKSGQWMSCEVPLQMNEAPQKFGSYLSYMRRYSLITFLVIASDDDDDANIYEGNDWNPRDRGAPSSLPNDYPPVELPPPETVAAETVTTGKPKGRAATNAPPKASPEDASFRKLVAAFNSAIKNAQDPAEADKIWTGEQELRAKMSLSTLEFVSKTFSDTWKRQPPGGASADAAPPGSNALDNSGHDAAQAAAE